MTNHIIDTLAKAAQEGCGESLDALMKHFYPKVRTMVQRRINDDDHAADVVQNTMMRAHRFLGGFRFQSSFRAWLYRIAENEIKNFYQRRHAHQIEQSSEETEIEPSVVSSCERINDQADVETTLTRLTPMYAQILILFYLRSYSVREIAATLSLGPSATKMRLLRAREAFAKGYGLP